jgi:hypothetical protein
MIRAVTVPDVGAPERVRTGASRALLPLHIALTSLVALAALGTIALRLHEPRQSHDSVAIACGLAVIGLIAYGRYGLRLAWMSASVVYLMLFWIFHYGLAFTAVVVPDVLEKYDDVDILWMYGQPVRLTLILAVIGAAGFTFGAAVLTGTRRERQPLETVENALDLGLYQIGWLLMLVGLFGTAVIFAVHGGLGVFAMGYQEFRNTVLAPTQLQTCVDTAQLGCLLALCGAGRRQWVAPLVVFSPLACAMMLVGLRTEAMVPFVTFAIALRYRGIRLHPGVLATAVVVSLVIIPAIRVFRLVGFENRSAVNWTEVSPLETLTELGGTLRAAKAYVARIEVGDEYLLGASYWAPFDRQVLTRIVPDREQIPFDDDVRLPSRLVPLYEGAVGTSALGEAYYNFGVVGPFIYFAWVGALFGWLERRAVGSPYYSALLGIMMSIFYFNIRGHWVAVPAQIAGGLAALAASMIVGRFLGQAPDVDVTAGEASFARGR